MSKKKVTKKKAATKKVAKKIEEPKLEEEIKEEPKRGEEPNGKIRSTRELWANGKFFKKDQIISNDEIEEELCNKLLSRGILVVS